MISPEGRGPPPVRTIPWPKHWSEISWGIYCACKRRPFDISTKAVTMETARFKSLPDAKGPSLHVSTNFHRTLSILDILNSNMAEFILRKYVFSSSLIKLKMQNLERCAIIPIKFVLEAIFPSCLYFLIFRICQDCFPCNFEFYSFYLDASEKAQTCLR